jgi:hypothetical protein
MGLLIFRSCSSRYKRSFFQTSYAILGGILLIGDKKEVGYHPDGILPLKLFLVDLQTVPATNPHGSELVFFSHNRSRLRLGVSRKD